MYFILHLLKYKRLTALRKCLAKHFVISLIFIVMTISPAMVNANNILANEYVLKVAYLYNFARFVTWPESTFNTNNEPVRFCFMGKDPFKQALRTIRNKKVIDRNLHIQRNISLQQTSQCQILFISKSEKNKLSDILNYTAQFPILTVSELPDFAQNNGHIRFFLGDDETLRLEINLEAIKQADIQISSRILTLAKIISSRKNTDKRVKP